MELKPQEKIRTLPQTVDSFILNGINLTYSQSNQTHSSDLKNNETLNKSSEQNILNQEETENKEKWNQILKSHVLKTENIQRFKKLNKNYESLEKIVFKVLVSIPYLDQNGMAQSLLTDPNLGREYFLEEVKMKNNSKKIVNILELESEFLNVDNVHRVQKNWEIREQVESIVDKRVLEKKNRQGRKIIQNLLEIYIF